MFFFLQKLELLFFLVTKSRWHVGAELTCSKISRGWTSQWECVILRRRTSKNCNWILSVNEKQVESWWVTCSKISRGSGSVRMWESQGGRQRVASGRPTGRTISPGSLTWPRPRRLRFSTQACHNFSDWIWLGKGCFAIKRADHEITGKLGQPWRLCFWTCSCHKFISLLSCLKCALGSFGDGIWLGDGKLIPI